MVDFTSNFRAAVVVALLLALLAPASADADAPWHAAGWSHRAIVTVTDAGSAKADAACVRIAHAGRAAASGDDYRIFDSGGQPVPYQLNFHHPRRDSLVSFRGQPGQTFSIYYGKTDAPGDPMRAILDPTPGSPGTPGSGPPKPGPASGGWIPRAGLVMTTMRRPTQPANPLNVAEMAQLIADSPGLDGAGLFANISSGLNPFGDSDYYISIFRGWIELPAAGEYGFCTASNEASFSFLDGKELVHWPGRHTEQRGKLGQKEAVHQLSAGLHYVEYYHEEVLLYQVAFLGYKPPGAPHYIGIPDKLFPQPHVARVQRYEQAPGLLSVTFRPELLDSVWPRARPGGQWTRYAFRADTGEEKRDRGGWSFRWSFGDGISASGENVEHVYLINGTYDTKLTATGPQGQKVELTWPLVVFPIEHLSAGFKPSQLRQYLPIVTGYDPRVMPTAAAAELARMLADGQETQPARLAAQVVMTRDDASPANLVAMSLLLGSMDHLRSALERVSSPLEMLQIGAPLLRALGEQNQLAEAERLYAQLQEQAKSAGRTGKIKAAFREATIAMGDARLYAQQYDKAGEDYRTAEALAEPRVPPQVRAAQIGSFPEAIEQHLAARRYEQALVIIQRWRERFPADQLRGTVLFYLGKTHLLRGEAAVAIRPLQLAMELGKGSEFEAESRWRLAEAFHAAGQPSVAEQVLRDLAASGLAGTWRDQALQATKEGP